MKRTVKAGFILLTVTFVLLTGGCTSQSVNPLVKNEATDVPGLAMNLHPASASNNNTDTVSAMLYFRYLDEPMLASESRTLPVRRDESVEFAIVEALVDGPSAGHSDLKRLLPMATQVESVIARNDILFVTLSEDFLSDDVPAQWMDNADWREEAPLQRRLTVQSIVASITERFSYTGIQILVHKQNEVQTSLRLDKAYFLTGEVGLSDPIARDESLLLTQQNTAIAILTAWQQHDFERLYNYIIEADKPSFTTMTETLSQKSSLSDYSVSGGSVAIDGQTATLSVMMRTQNKGVSMDTTDYPMQLNRENGIWKIAYSSLTAMMSR